VRFAVHVDGFQRKYTKNLPIFIKDDILSPRSIDAMTTLSSPASCKDPRNPLVGSAKGWQVNKEFNNWFKPGGMPGTTAYLLRTETGVCVAVLANSWQRGRDPAMIGSIEAIVDTILKLVREWPTHDLFSLYDDPWPSAAAKLRASQLKR
jgi:hypothetical protein